MGFCCVFGRRPLHIVPAQDPGAGLVAKFRFGGLNGCHLVGHFNHIKVRLQEVGHLLDFVFVQADHAHTDQVRDPVLDLVGRIALFQGCAVFAAEFANALFHVLTRPSTLEISSPGAASTSARTVLTTRARGLQLRKVVGVEVAELGFFQLQGIWAMGVYRVVQLGICRPRGRYQAWIVHHTPGVRRRKGVVRAPSRGLKIVKSMSHTVSPLIMALALCHPWAGTP